MSEIITIILSLLACAVLTYALVGFIVVRRLVDFGKQITGEREIGPWKRRLFTGLGVVGWPLIAFVYWRVAQTTAVARTAVGRGIRVWKVTKWLTARLRSRVEAKSDPNLDQVHLDMANSYDPETDRFVTSGPERLRTVKAVSERATATIEVS